MLRVACVDTSTTVGENIVQTRRADGLRFIVGDLAEVICQQRHLLRQQQVSTVLVLADEHPTITVSRALPAC